MGGWVAGGSWQVVKLAECEARAAGQGKERGSWWRRQHQNPRLRTFWLQGALPEISGFFCTQALPTWAMMMPHTPSTPRNLISGAGGWFALAPFHRTILAPARVSKLLPPEAMMSREDVELYSSPCTLLQVYTEHQLFSAERIEFDSMNASYISSLKSKHRAATDHIFVLYFRSWHDRTKASQLVLCLRVMLESFFLRGTFVSSLVYTMEHC